MMQVKDKVRAFLALGANLDSREGNLERAVSILSAKCGIYLCRVSSIYESPPADDSKQSDYLNQVLELETWLTPEELLSLCLAVEDEMGRVRKKKNDPRKIDIDILLYGDLIITDDDWVVLAPPVPPRLVAVKGDNKVTLRWNPDYELGKNTETDPDSRSGVADFDGYVVWRSTVGFDVGWTPVLWIDKISSHNDVYYPWGWRISGYEPPNDRRNERIPDGSGSFTEPNLTGVNRITFESVGADSSPVRRDSKGYYEWVDNSVTNGATYYYSVTPYDFGTKPLNGTQPGTDEKPRIAGKTSNAVVVVPIMSASSNLDRVTVAPNPYRGSADWDEWTGSGIRLGRVWFMNLPEECTITIYTISGDPVRILEHKSQEIGAEPWDLTGGSGVAVASGIYVYQIEAGD
ncbi:MAG: 2-amino-4-hydroxy-6-hydroxymethyldihydropteridine diphosphokinase, partial [bacterium]|nr:2-amino-4-hydroxy-6-hydroxymethyldihydropteridine diphosphokinase [bacterium]